MTAGWVTVSRERLDRLESENRRLRGRVNDLIGRVQELEQALARAAGRSPSGPGPMELALLESMEHRVGRALIRMQRAARQRAAAGRPAEGHGEEDRKR